MRDRLQFMLADLLKWIGWRLIRLADRLDDPPSDYKVGGTDPD